MRTREEVLAELAAMPALPLLTEAWEGEGAARALVLSRTLVRPGEAAWERALAQNAARLGLPG